jgi:hypothetical protein
MKIRNLSLERDRRSSLFEKFVTYSSKKIYEFAPESFRNFFQFIEEAIQGEKAEVSNHFESQNVIAEKFIIQEPM